MAETRHVYRVSPWRSRLLYGFWALFAIPLTVGGLVTGEPSLLVVAFVFSAIALPFFIWAVRAAKLTVTPEGIELRQAAATLRTTWENVEEIRLVRGAEGIVTRGPIEGKGAERYATTSQMVIRGAPLYDEHRRGLLAEKRFIPIEPFGHWLRKGDLRQVLSRYAPDLVRQADETAAVEAQRPQKLSTNQILVISGIIVISIGVGLWSAMQQDQPLVIQILLGVVALAIAVTALRNILSAVSLFRARRFGSGLFWGGFAVLQVLIVLQLLSQIAG